jgi:hypothetical protein
VECGAADANWSGNYDTLDDAAFIALVNQIAPCFQDLVSRGEMSADDLPPELTHPECLNGRNPYALDQDDPAFDAFFDCVYG